MTFTWSGIVDLPPSRHVPLIGRVGEFDDDRGLGVIEYGERRRFPFHCTAITDGTRQIAIGTLVACEVSPGRLGRLEAVSVRPLSGMPAPGRLHDLVSEPGSETATWSEPNPQFMSPEASPDESPSEWPVEPESPDESPSEWPVESESPDESPSELFVEPEPTGVLSIALLAITPPAGVPVGPLGPVVETPATESFRDPVRKPDFWSVNKSAPTGPPPTWVTPVAPRSDGGSGSDPESDPSASS